MSQLSQLWPSALNLALAVITVSAVFGVILLAGQRLNPPIKESTIKAALIALLACPLLVWIAMRYDLASIRQQSPAPQMREQVIGDQAPTQIAAPLKGEAAVPTPQKNSLPLSNIAPKVSPASSLDYASIALSIWLAGTVFLLLKAGIDRWRLKQLVRRWHPVTELSLLSMLDESAKQAGLATTPRAVQSTSLAAPVCFVQNQPTIVLPADLTNFLSPDQIRAALLHECMHLKARHQSWRMLSALTVALYWWIIPVWLIRRSLEDAQEKVCDSFVVQTTQTGRNLAECLVALASRTGSSWTPKGAIAVFRRGQLESRIRRLLDEGASNMTTITKRSLAATAGLAIAAMVVATKLQVGAHQSQGMEFFPTLEGTRWTYHVSYPGEKGQTWIKEAWSRKTYKGEPVMEYRQYMGGYTDYQYLLFTKEGAYPMSRQYKDIPGFRDKASDTPELIFPPKTGSVWTARYPVPYQTLSRLGEPTPKHDPIIRDVEYKVVSDSVPMSTPLGDKSCLLLEVRAREGNAPFALSMRRWLCPGIGVVREESYDRDGKVSQTLELTEFKLGDPEKQTPENPVQLVKAANAQNLDNSHLLRTYRSRFVSAKESGKTTIYRVNGKSVTEFDPAQPDAWNQLIAQEMPPARDSMLPMPSGYDNWLQLETIGLLCAVQAGHTVDDKTQSGQNEFNSTGNSKIVYGKTAIRGKDKDGKPWVVQVNVTFDANKVTRIEIQ